MKKLTIFSAIILVAISAKAEQLTSEDYIEQWKITAINQMNSHNIPASITLAQGILESGNGNSNLARSANNHFGIKCHKGWDGATFFMDDDAKDECFRSYDNASQSYEDHSLFLTGRTRYAGLFELSITDYKGWAKGLKSAGYATNPKYADLLITIIERHDLDQYDLMPYLPSEVAKAQEQKELSVKPKVDSPNSTLQNSKEIVYDMNASGHNVEINKYNLKYIIVKEGDSFYKISKEFEISLWQLYKYNELGKRDVLAVGEIIYLEPKRTKAKKGFNVFVTPIDMTLRDVSQAEGIKLKKLLKYNVSDDADRVLPKGTKVILR
jgi:LysM repeat protein